MSISSLSQDSSIFAEWLRAPGQPGQPGQAQGIPGGMVIDPNDPNGLPANLQGLVAPAKEFLDANPGFGDTIDTTGELQQFMKYVEDLMGTQGQNTLAPEASGLTADILQALIQYLADGGKTREQQTNNGQGMAGVPSLGNSNFANSQPANWSPNNGPGAPTSGAANRPSGPSQAGPPAPSTPGEQQTVEQMKERTPPDIRARAEAVDPSRIPHYDRRSPKAQWGARVALAMGLRINDTTDGQPGDGIHSKGSLHYDENDPQGRIRAVDVGGSADQMANYFNVMRQIDPGSTELFYDPEGGVKHGQEIAAIGGHSNHVHYGAA